MKNLILLAFVGATFLAAQAKAQIIYNNDFPTTQNNIAIATRPDSPGGFEIEAGDDFVLTSNGHITGATFTGLVPPDLSLSNIGSVVVEIYRVFPNDSDVNRTSGPATTPPFSTVNVPTRANSPSDVAFASRESGTGLTFTTSFVSADFVASNSVQPGGIHPKPNQTTGGDGPVTGDEIRFNINFTDPFNLAPGHYFFVPQVELTGTDGSFLWLSANRPIVSPPGTSFPPGFTDLQAWTRDDNPSGNIQPDWLRVGTDIVGGSPAPTFNTAFSLSGTVPDAASTVLLLSGAVIVLICIKRRIRVS